MYEFDLGNTFNYAEMAALIAPRPFMVERGHDDGVGLDEYVAFEYAKVRRLYARLGIADRTEIEFFAGGHEINLRRHARVPAKAPAMAAALSARMVGPQNASFRQRDPHAGQRPCG